MWSTEEQGKIKKLRIDSIISRDALTALVKHFKKGGSLFQVHKKGNPLRASQGLARKVKDATNNSSLDWLLAGNESEGVAGIDEVPWPTISEEWPHLFLNNGEDLRGIAARRFSTRDPQQAGDEFVLDLGEELDARGVRLLQGTQHQWDHPKRWRMTISDNNRIIEEVEGTGYIEAKFGETVSVRMIGVEILEPRLPTDHPPAACWAVDNIEVGPADWEFGLLHTAKRRK